MKRFEIFDEDTIGQELDWLSARAVHYSYACADEACGHCLVFYAYEKAMLSIYGMRKGICGPLVLTR